MIGLWLRTLPRPVSLSVTSAAPDAGGTPLRMVVSTVLVGTLVEASGALGAGLAGILASAPVILSIIVPATHRKDGAAHAVTLARGALAALPASVLAIAILAESLDRFGPLGTVAMAVCGLVAVESVRETQDRGAVRQRDLDLCDLRERDGGPGRELDVLVRGKRPVAGRMRVPAAVVHDEPVTERAVDAVG